MKEKKIVFDNKIVLITGGTGTFGRALTERLLSNGIKEVRVLSRDEKKQDDMRRELIDEKVKFYIGDVRDITSIQDAFRGVDYVFHAAALKQVPSCEFFPMEAVKTNIIGTDNVITACINNKVEKAVFLSTDKAVYPINAMGISKALMEKNVIARSRQLLEGDPVLCLTRYGNVIGSRGSVIPLFLDQISKGQDLTITNPNMTRFMMTIDEALDLVEFAFEHGEQGDLFVKKSPAATIDLIADALLKITNSKVSKQIIGIRHGEKMFESLITVEERLNSQEYSEYVKIRPDNRDLNYRKYFEKGSLNDNPQDAYNSNNTKQMTLEEVIDILKKYLEKLSRK